MTTDTQTTGKPVNKESQKTFKALKSPVPKKNCDTCKFKFFNNLVGYDTCWQGTVGHSLGDTYMFHCGGKMWEFNGKFE